MELINISLLSEAMDRAGMHLVCVLNMHNFNKNRICRNCKFIDPAFKIGHICMQDTAYINYKGKSRKVKACTICGKSGKRAIK